VCVCVCVCVHSEEKREREPAHMWVCERFCKTSCQQAFVTLREEVAKDKKVKLVPCPAARLAGERGCRKLGGLYAPHVGTEGVSIAGE